MFPAATKAGGVCLGLPDVCNTPAPPGPPVPIVYVNKGDANQALKASSKVKFAGKEAITQRSEIPRSSGDEAGVTGGLKSATFMLSIIWVKGSSKEKIQGQPCMHLLAQTQQNSKNTVGALVRVKQNKVIVAP